MPSTIFARRWTISPDRLADLDSGCTGTTAFPIFDNLPEYGDKEPSLLAGINDPAARRSIEELQPYHARAHLAASGTIDPYHPLAVNLALLAIGRLDNRDKHRLLLPAIPMVPFVREDNDWEGVASATVAHVRTPWVRLEEGAELLRLRDVKMKPGHTEVKVRRSPPFTLTFGDPELDVDALWLDQNQGSRDAR